MTTNADLEESTNDYVMPGVEAVLMATMALMTGHAQNTNEHHLKVMAHRIGENLEVLVDHPGLSTGFRSALKCLIAPWTEQCWVDGGVVVAGRKAFRCVSATRALQ